MASNNQVAVECENDPSHSCSASETNTKSDDVAMDILHLQRQLYNEFEKRQVGGQSNKSLSTGNSNDALITDLSVAMDEPEG